MQALSSYNSDQHSAVDRALRALENRTQGLIADSLVSPGGFFARFVWADWPPELCGELESSVRAFRAQHREFRPVEMESADWDAVFHGWRTDAASVSAIAAGFSKHFGNRLLWVESEKDVRGRVAGQCMIEQIGKITLDLSWKDSLVLPPPSLSESDKEKFESGVKEVFQWAERRIRSVLDALHDCLQKLYGERFRGLYVFGSYARPDAGIELPGDSDLDVALILDEFQEAAKEIIATGQITSDLSLEHGLVISLIPVREADFKEKRTNFTRVLSQDAIRVG